MGGEGCALLEPARAALQEAPQPGMGWGPRGPLGREPPPGQNTDLEFSLGVGG